MIEELTKFHDASSKPGLRGLVRVAFVGQYDVGMAFYPTAAYCVPIDKRRRGLIH